MFFDSIPMTDKAQLAISDAGIIAMLSEDPYVASEHLLLALAEDTGVARLMLEKFELDRTIIDEAVQRSREASGLMRIPTKLGYGDAKFDVTFKKAVDLAWNEATYFGGPRGERGIVGTEHLLIGLALDPNGFAGQFLPIRGADYVHLRRQLHAMNAEEPARV